MNAKIYLGALTLALFTSCVSTKKYDELAYQKRQLEAEKMDMTSTIASNERMINDLKAKEQLLMQREQELARLAAKLKDSKCHKQT